MQFFFSWCKKKLSAPTFLQVRDLPPSPILEFGMIVHCCNGSACAEIFDLFLGAAAAPAASGWAPLDLGRWQIFVMIFFRRKLTMAL